MRRDNKLKSSKIINRTLAEKKTDCLTARESHWEWGTSLGGIVALAMSRRDRHLQLAAVIPSIDKLFVVPHETVNSTAGASAGTEKELIRRCDSPSPVKAPINKPKQSLVFPNGNVVLQSGSIIATEFGLKIRIALKILLGVKAPTGLATFMDTELLPMLLCSVKSEVRRPDQVGVCVDVEIKRVNRGIKDIDLSIRKPQRHHSHQTCDQRNRRHSQQYGTDV